MWKKVDGSYLLRVFTLPRDAAWEAVQNDAEFGIFTVYRPASFMSHLVKLGLKVFIPRTF